MQQCTDELKRAFVDALERRRVQIDRRPGLRTVRLLGRLDREGHCTHIVYSEEAEERLGWSGKAAVDSEGA